MSMGENYGTVGLLDCLELTELGSKVLDLFQVSVWMEEMNNQHVLVMIIKRGEFPYFYQFFFFFFWYD